MKTRLLSKRSYYPQVVVVKMDDEKRLGIFEKYLTLWIAICIIIGLLLGRFLPAFGEYLDSLKIGQLSIPIGICLFFMMYPTVVQIRFGDVIKASKNPKPLLLTIAANWIINPPLATLLANTFLAGQSGFIAGVILLGISPCTAMVMWWIMLARGDLGQGLVNTAINALLMVILYAPLAAFYLGVSAIPVPWDLIALSVLLFIALPVASGSISRWAVIKRKGQEWFDEKYVPVWGKISIIALLTTLIVMFSLEGETIINQPLTVGLIAAPLLLGYAIMVSLTYVVSWFANWKYESSITNALIGSSSHFEVAIAVATTLFGIGSGAALATVIGPLMEVPIMLLLVKVGLWTRRYFPRNRISEK
ncbi:MAG: ACR3 family arsenite efflux transporter [Candidatus Hodarchaeota archaeon]